MEKRPTIKDVARAANVSTGTVHLVLNDKVGVSEETRERVKKIASEIGYRPNHLAAGLKRKALRIAVVLPMQTNENLFYFTHQWKGVQDYIDSMRDYNIEMIPVPYFGDQIVTSEVLESIFTTQMPDGIICAGFVDASGVKSFKRFTKQRVPIVLVGGEAPDIDILCITVPQYRCLGNMLAEQLLLVSENKEGKYLIASGRDDLPSHYMVVEGFLEYATKAGISPERIVQVPSYGSVENDVERLSQVLSEETYAGCCAVTARGSVALGRAIENMELSGSIKAIGSDVFAESIEYLQKGVFCNLIQKNPYQQAYYATQCLVEYLVQDKKPIRTTWEIGIEMVFKSTVAFHTKGF